MTSEAQPGQEQRMVTDAMIDAMLANLRDRRLLKWLFDADADTHPHAIGHVDGPIDVETQREICRTLATIALAARPTADLGDDGELERELHNEAHDLANRLPARQAMEAAADRLILYREALEVLLLVKDAVDYRGDACHPAEMVGAVLDKCILERIDAVLSSDRKVAGGSGSA